jgi:DeoR family ulaG and ulaABCDEF operon transcriptional repressor
VRVHGGARLAEGADSAARPGRPTFGTPFEQAITENLAAKQAIGRAAAALCQPGEGIMIDGGTTTCRCAHTWPGSISRC